MAISVKQYAQALHEALQEVSEREQDLVIGNLVETLKRNDDLSKFEQIIYAYEQLAQSAGHIAHVTTAEPIHMDSKILDTLNTIAQGKVAVQAEVDESIVGGVVVRVDDSLLDASIKTKLEQLKTKLEQ